MCSATQHERVRGCEGKAPGSVHLFLCLEFWLLDHLTWTYFYAASLFRSLGSASAPTAHCSRNAQQISLLLPAKGSASHNLIAPLFGPSPTVISRLKCCVCASFELFFFLTRLVCFRLPTFRYFKLDLSDVLVRWVGNHCWMIAVQIIEILSRENREIFHATIPRRHSTHVSILALSTVLEIFLIFGWHELIICFPWCHSSKKSATGIY